MDYANGEQLGSNTKRDGEGRGVVWVLRQKNLINASLGCEGSAEVKLQE